METPYVSGIYKGYGIELFGSEYMRVDGRGTRKRTALEISVKGKAPTTGAIASGDLVTLANSPDLNLGTHITIDQNDWNSAWVARVKDHDAAKEYLTEKRIHALSHLMQTPHAWVILMMANDEMLLRIDTPDPLDEPSRIDALTRMMVHAAKILEVPTESDLV